MITAIFAVGTHGEFGLNGKLPWGSFKEELEAYRNALSRVLSGFNGMPAILVGATTWDSLPKSAKEFILSKTKKIFVYSRKPYTIPSADVHIISSIGYRIPDELDLYNIVCIGGARLLKELWTYGWLDKAYISHIYDEEFSNTFNDCNARKGFIADSHLYLDTKDLTSELIAIGSSKERPSLSFTQELYYL